MKGKQSSNNTNAKILKIIIKISSKSDYTLWHFKIETGDKYPNAE